jgi:GNAT superfamily N-acetyltransferase
VTISIRRATANDADETSAIFSASLRSMAFFPKLHSDDDERAFVHRFIAEDETWIALRGGRILGIACIKGDRLMHLYVDPAHHNRGVGTALLVHMKKRRPDGFDLWCFQANTSARRFYDRHGLRAVEFTDGRGNEEKLPDIRYVWP